MSNGCCIACYHCKEEIYLDKIGWELFSPTEHPQLWGYSTIDTEPLAYGEWDVGTPKMVAELKATVGDFLEQHRDHLVYLRSDDDIRYYGNYEEAEFSFETGNNAGISILKGQTSWIGTVAFSPDGRYLASGGGDRIIKIWDLASQSNIMNLSGHQDWIASVAFHPDGKVLLSASGDRQIKLWDYQTGEEKHSWQGSFLNFETALTHNPIVSAGWTPSGENIISADLDQGNRVKIWSLQTHALQHKLHAKTPFFRIPHFAISSLGNYIAIASEPLAWSPDGQFLAIPVYEGDSTDRAYNVKIYHILSGEIQSTLDLAANRYDRIYDIQFSPDGAYLACSIAGIQQIQRPREGSVLADIVWHENNSIKLFDLARQESRDLVTGYPRIIPSLSFSPDGQSLAAASYDGTILLWNLQKLNCATVGEGDRIVPLGAIARTQPVNFAPASIIKLWELSDRES